MMSIRQEAVERYDMRDTREVRHESRWTNG
jgi:hypothetical protein